MAPFLKFHQLLILLFAFLHLLLFPSHATLTTHTSQISSPSNDLVQRIQPSHNEISALTVHAKRASITRDTFYRGLWTLALTTTAFLASGPSTSPIAPAIDIESFAHQIIAQVTHSISVGAAEQTHYGWDLDGTSFTFASYPDPLTGAAPTVPWGVIQEFLIKFVLWRAQRGATIAFEGTIWGPGRIAVTVVLRVMAASSESTGILDSASEIHGNG